MRSSLYVHAASYLFDRRNHVTLHLAISTLPMDDSLLSRHVMSLQSHFVVHPSLMYPNIMMFRKQLPFKFGVPVPVRFR